MRRGSWSADQASRVRSPTGLVLVIAVELGLITSVGVFNPVFATYRLDQLPGELVARALSAWAVTSNVTVAALTALWGLLADVTNPRAAIAVGGLLLLTSPLLLPRQPGRPAGQAGRSPRRRAM
jgi:MFS family permease